LAPETDPSQDSNENMGLLKMAKFFVILTNYYSGDQIKQNEKGGASSTHWIQERCIQDFDGDT